MANKATKLIILLVFVIILFTAKEVNAAVIQRAPNNLGLVGYWSFNEATSTKATDFSGNKNTGTLTGASHLPTWTGGKMGSALKFDGVDDRVTMPDSSSLRPSAVTVSAWIKRNGTQVQWAEAVNKLLSGSPWYSWALELNISGTDSSQISAYVCYATAQIRVDSVTGAIPDQTWTFVTETYDGTNLRLYINGKEDANSPTINAKTILYDNSVLEIGGWTDYQLFKGLIDEVRVYNRALTAAEVATLYKSSALSQVNPSAQNKKLTSGLVGLWSFNGADMDWASSTAEALDKSGNNNNGNVINGPQVAVGQVGQALSFDGSNDYVDCADGGRLNLVDGNFSVSAWVKIDVFLTDGLYPRILYKGETAAKGYSLMVTATAGVDTFQFGTRDAGGTYYRVFANYGKLINTWYHVVGVQSAGVLSIYVNGVQEAGADIAATPTINTATNFQIGQRGDNLRWWDGLIDEVRVYNRALSASDISELYKMGAARVKPDKSLVNVMKESLLVGHWTFNGPDISNAANLAYDRSGQSPANNGTMINMATTSRYAIGISGQALKFDGVDDYVSIDNLDIDNYSILTLEAWVYSKEATPYRVVFGNDNINYDRGLSSGCGLGNNARWCVFVGDNEADTGTDVTLNTWNHVVVVYSSADTEFYLNGVRIWNKGSQSTGYDGSPSFKIGRSDFSGGSSYFKGLIDEVRIYNRALTASEVLQLYRAEGGR